MKVNFLTPAIAWNLFGTVISGVLTPLVTLVIATKFTPELQGYYYTFSSLLALSVFLELGFSGCISQFVSHEYAFLSLSKGILAKNPSGPYDRLVSLVKISIKWYLIAAILLFIGLGIGGEYFFGDNAMESFINWRSPWWLLCLASSANLLTLPLVSVLEGCNQVSWTVKTRVIQNLARSFSLLISVSFGFGLYSPAISIFTGLAVFVCMYCGGWSNFLFEIIRHRTVSSVSWIKEILPLQWRLAVSWACGYFIYSSFNPLVFKNLGATAAGQFGLTWSLLSALSTVAGSFVSTRTPTINALTAKKEFDKVETLWYSAFRQGLIVYVVLAAALWAMLYELVEWRVLESTRILEGRCILVLIIGGAFNQIVSSIAIRVRANKSEPFLGSSIFIALLILVGNLCVVAQHGIIGICIVYTSCMLLFSVLAYNILLSVRKTQITVQNGP